MWATPDVELVPIECRHPRTTPAVLCTACRHRLVRMLRDLPDLDQQLTTAAADQDPDGGRSHYGRRAVWQHRKLGSSLGGTIKVHGSEWARHLPQLLLNQDFPRRVYRFSTAFVEARHVVDRPSGERFIGPCPVCTADLYAPEPDDLDMSGQMVWCRSCGTAVNVQRQRRAWLSTSDDRWLTVTELVAVISEAGEPITRNQVNWWAKTRRMERRYRQVPRGVDGSGDVQSASVAVYQLGTVRGLARDAAGRKS